MVADMENSALQIKIPEKRIAVLIGTAGETKRRIEKTFKCRLAVSDEGEVAITSKGYFKSLRAKEAVSAIARGFSPDHAMLLKSEEMVLEIINLQDYVGKREKALERVKSRLIGTAGKARRNIEEMTLTSISIYGKTAAIIGKAENVINARDAIMLLLTGRSHKASYDFLRRKKQE